MSSDKSTENNIAGQSLNGSTENQGNAVQPQANPQTRLKSEPTVMVVFGGTGDLAERKLAPAFFNLFIDGMLPDNFEFIGLGRTEFSDDKFNPPILQFKL